MCSSLVVTLLINISDKSNKSVKRKEKNAQVTKRGGLANKEG